MRKLHNIFISIVGLLLAGFAIVSAAPTETITQNLYPQTTDTYSVGTTTRQYLNGYFKNIYLDGNQISTSSTPTWGNITGILSNQTDLQSALDAKLSTSTAASTYYLQTNPSGYISLGSLSASAPLGYNSGTGAFSITKASSTVDGYLSSTDWTTFNNKVSSQWTSTSTGIFYNGGRVGIGTAAPGYALDVNGAMNTNNTLYFTNGSGNKLGITASTTLTDHNYILPPAQGTSGTFLKNDGSGNLTWGLAPTSGLSSTYAYAASSTVAAYKSLSTTIPTSTNPIVYTSKTLTVASTTIDQWLTAASYPNKTTIPAGTWQIHLDAYVNSTTGTKPVRLYAEIYKYATTTVETVLFTTQQSEIITVTDLANPQEVFLDISSNPILLNSDDRLGYRVYAITSGAGTNPTINLGYENETFSGLTIPSLAIDTTKFVPYSGATQGLNMGAFGLTATNLSVTNATTTNLSIGTLNGILKGTTGSVGTATADVDYLTPATASSTYLHSASNLSDLASSTVARTNLGLGDSATLASSTWLKVANNLSDLNSSTTARTNLGLGTMATQNANAVAITGGNAILTNVTSTVVLTNATSSYLAADTNGKIIATTTPSSGGTSISLTAGEDISAQNAVVMSDGNVTKINPDISQTSKNTGTPAYDAYWDAQSFIATSTTVSKINLYTSTGPIGNKTFTVKIRSSLTGSDIGSTTFGTTGGEGEVLHSAIFSTAVSGLTIGNTYYIIVYSNGTSSAYPSLSINTPSAYADGQMYHSTDSGTNWSSDATIDFYFVLYASYDAGTVLQSNATIANARANSFIGFSQSAITSGNTGTINLIGTVIDGFSGLSPGYIYYLSNSAGLISTSAGAQSRKIGVALSTTQLLARPDNP